MNVQVGDRVSVFASIMGREYWGEGVVERVLQNNTTGEPYVQLDDGSYWAVRNDLLTRCEVTERAIQSQQRRDSGLCCHYCGMPAVGFGFFDEPVCRECGG